MYAHIYATYKITDVKHSTNGTVDKCYIYGINRTPHISHLAHTANTLHGYTDTALLQICVKKLKILLQVLLPNMSRNKYSHAIGHTCHISPTLDV